jgi:hypothetical protein
MTSPRLGPRTNCAVMLQFFYITSSLYRVFLKKLYYGFQMLLYAENYENVFVMVVVGAMMLSTKIRSFT